MENQSSLGLAPSGASDSAGAPGGGTVGAQSSGRAPVSVVVVNYNAGSLLLECVSVCLEQADEVIVIDNASTDGSLGPVVRRFALENRLHILCPDRNLGFAAGCNLGVRQATCPLILFLNPDCILQPGSLQRMVDAMVSNPAAGMVGGLLLDPDGKEQGGGRRAVPTPWRSFVRAFGLHRLVNRWPDLFFDFHLHHQPLPDGATEVEAISGALTLVRREAMAEVGTWDEGYFLHCEDLDWCVRFREKGWKILFVPDAPAVHYRGACSQSRPLFVEWHKHKGMLRFYRKFFSRRYPSGVMWLVGLGVWLRFAAVAVIHTTRYARRAWVEGRG